MILVVNCFNEETFAEDFDRVVSTHFQRAGHQSEHLRAGLIEELGDLARFTHLVISGSVASATEEQPWDRALAALVHRFMDAGKPILGICYGHQFLAKVLAGPEHVRHAPAPEFGFLRLRLAPNPLFRGMDEAMVMVSHFDEACDLPDGFRILAASADCAALAFQYRDLPVWGVQFHPEYGPREGERIWNEVFCCTPGRIPPAPAEPARMDQNHLIFKNFAEAESAFGQRLGA
ncbi:MAG: gamma-glutamyl-gamma-aminobutyrate hydrolase family protein [Holophaga sp.]|nr:gamma-glutamyl-gamma-aminobutyrate hydrolase family protein [Holophaga sp.]